MCPSFEGASYLNTSSVMTGSDRLASMSARNSFDSNFSMTSVRSNLPQATVPNKALHKNHDKSTNDHPEKSLNSKRRRRPESGLDEFDEALQFLQRFHATSTRSLDAISEDSEQGFPLIRRERKVMRKTKTFHCLSSLSQENLETADVATSSRRYSAPPSSTARDEKTDDWGFFEAGTMSMSSLEDSDSSVATPATTSWLPSQ